MQKNFGKKRNHVGKVVAYVLAFGWMMIDLIPLFLAIISSFKNNNEIYSRPWGLPKIFRIENYITAIADAGALKAIGNSIIISLISAAGTIFVALLASYAISRIKVKWVKKIYVLFVISVMIPVHVTLIPISSLATAVQGKNTIWFLLMIYIAFNLAQAIFLISGFMEGISREIDEAATIDGCGHLSLLFRIITPICIPILATEAIFAFVNAYGELIFSLTLISSVDKFTVSRAMLSFTTADGVYLGPVYAFIVLSIIPSILIYIVFHKRIQAGAMSGAIKG